ncbi:MAG: DinB family protein [Ferruginibacter sp.]|nr:DinB family protein [Ferruginibacter sp.]
MHLQEAIKKVFVQLSDTLQQLTPMQYAQQCTTLFNATIGQHVRHIIELFIELDNGYAGGTVNYDKRKRDIRIETDLYFANETLLHLHFLLDRPDKELLLETAYSENSHKPLPVATNYQRELLYNLEHTIHHMALIRVGINEVATIPVPENFGMAASTIKHRTACAQ